MWLFLDLLAAESLVVLVSSLFPNFVVALALTAFANGLWMSVGGFLVSPTILNPFWRYVFHYIDYVSPHLSLNRGLQLRLKFPFISNALQFLQPKSNAPLSGTYSKRTSSAE